MPTKLRKTRKMRGSKTHGYGSKKKHRGKGSKGGKGYAGSHKHKWIKIIKEEPEHFGKHGFTSIRGKESKTINIKDLERLIKDFREGKIDIKNDEIKEDDEKIEINLTKLGYDKLLGKGKLNFEKPIIIIVKSFSQQAKQKIESANGKIITEEVSKSSV
ncbi:MAG: uL15 family ribosomal protein [Candidatus Aenigmatarchaeota archaeon]|nr:50S ribosomal protein L15 [Candidatus Aenigmarchaeota archaeon]